MDISEASEWSSSGCESGWTLYLDESISQSPNQYQQSSRRNLHQSHTPNADDEEDFSMVSDASSGPPHFHYGDQGEHDKFRFYPPSAKSEQITYNHHSFLDDTASSPALHYPNRCVDQSNNQASINHLFGFSQGNGFSRENSAFGHGQIGLWQSTHARQQEPAEPSRSRARRRV